MGTLHPFAEPSPLLISSSATMVVTSRMLAAHTSGYPVDEKARFWSHYYRSLKDITQEEIRPRVSDSLPARATRHEAPGPMVQPKSPFALVLNTISPTVRPASQI